MFTVCLVSRAGSFGKIFIDPVGDLSKAVLSV
jgi:hypothetical protein